MSEIPKFAATTDPVDMGYYGEGDTIEAAIDDFKVQCLAEYIDCYGISEELELEVWTTCRPEDSDWPSEGIDPKWEWVLDDLDSVHTINLSEYLFNV